MIAHLCTGDAQWDRSSPKSSPVGTPAYVLPAHRRANHYPRTHIQKRLVLLRHILHTTRHLCRLAYIAPLRRKMLRNFDFRFRCRNLPNEKDLPKDSRNLGCRARIYQKKFGRNLREFLGIGKAGGAWLCGWAVQRVSGAGVQGSHISWSVLCLLFC